MGNGAASFSPVTVPVKVGATQVAAGQLASYAVHAVLVLAGQGS